MLSIAKKLAFFRANVNSADEGIDDLCSIGINGNHVEAEPISLHDEMNGGSSSDTEGEDMVSEEDESKRDNIKSNGHHYDPPEEQQETATNEIRYVHLKRS